MGQFDCETPDPRPPAWPSVIAWGRKVRRQWTLTLQGLQFSRGSVSSTSPDSKRVLVVDDDAISLQIAALLLEAEGYEVEQAGSGEDALQALRKAPGTGSPDVLLIDLQMPGISGNALAACIRDLSQAHLIAMSGTEPGDGQVSGFDGFVLKPLNAADFRRVLATGRKTSTPAAVDDETVLDPAVLARLRDLMPEPAVAQVFEACLHDARKRVGWMRELLKAGNFAAIRSEAHTIKGGASMVGAVRMATIAAALEHNVYQEDDLQLRLDELLYACDDTERILFRHTQIHG